jgi:DNA-binding GntR family transcriptional regulator
MAVSDGAIRSVREQIVDQLRNEVLADQLSAQQPLREVELAERFGVSRGPIRDALLQLTQEGALVYAANRGVRVGTPASDEIRDLLVVLRRQIETGALEQIFDRLTEEDDDRWREILDQLQRACERENMPAIVEHDIAFHRSLVRRTGSADLEAIWLPITVRMRLKYSRHKNLIEVYNEHAHIVDHIIRRNLKSAVKLLAKHIV